MSDSIIFLFGLAMFLVALIPIDLVYYLKFGNAILHNDYKDGYEGIGF